MNNERVYTDSEIVKIIERAVRRQEAEPDRQPQHGLTLREIERMGEEVGIDPEHLRRAAAEVHFDGGTSAQEADRKAEQVRAERWISGRLSDVAIEDMCANLKNRLGSDFYWSWGWWGRTGNEVKRMGRTHEWTHSAARVTVTDHDDGYTLRVFGPQIFSGTTTEAVALVLVATVGLGGLFAGGIGEVYGVMWAIMILVIACALSAAIIPRMVTRNRARNKQKVESIADHAQRNLQAAANPLDGEVNHTKASLSLPKKDGMASNNDMNASTIRRELE